MLLLRSPQCTIVVADRGLRCDVLLRSTDTVHEIRQVCARA